MKIRFTPALLAAALVAAALPVQAGISIDRPSPSITVCPGPISPATLYLQLMPPTGGCDVGWGLGPQVEVLDVNYGLIATDNTDAASANNQYDAGAGFVYVFSGDRASQGLFGTPYRGQFANNQAASDLFRSGVPSVSPATVMGGPCNPPAVIAGPWPVLYRNQTDFNLITTNAPAVAAAGAQDNLDALELDNFDPDADWIHELGVYFSLDPTSPTLALLGPGTPADLFYSPPGAGPGVFATAAQMGLGAGNDVDAVTVWDRNLAGTAEAGIDYAVFSVRPGSAMLAGPDAAPGTPDDFSPADLFVTDFTGAFCLYLRHNQLGMRFQDNIDGLDVIFW